MRSNSVVTTFLASSLITLMTACAGPNGEPDFLAAGDGGSGGGDADSDGLDIAAPLTAEISGEGGSAEAPPKPEGQAPTKFEAPSPALDACGGLIVDVYKDTDLSFAATTIGGHDDFKTWCGDTGPDTAAPDVVYQIVQHDECVLTLTVTDSSETFDPVLEVRETACETSQGGDSCSGRAENVESMSYHAIKDHTRWAIIDGATKDDAGDFLFHVQCKPVTCGDKIVSPGEECDDGNTVDGDGCSAICKFEAPSAADTCTDLETGIPIAVAPGLGLSLPGSGPMYANGGADVHDNYLGSCAWEEGGFDQVFEIVPSADGTMTAHVGSDYDGIPICQAPDYDQPGCRDHTLYVREANCAEAEDLACAQSNADDLTTTLEFPVTAGTHYYLFVDGYDGEYYSTGAYNLTLDLE